MINSSHEQDSELLSALERLKPLICWKLKQMGLENDLQVNEVIAEIFISVRGRQSSSSIAKLGAYLRTCIHHYLIKISQKKKKEMRSQQPVETLSESLTSFEEKDTEIIILFHSLKSLSILDRRIIELNVLEDKTSQQVAEQLRLEGYQITPDNVRQKKKRAMDKLRELY